MVVDAIWKYLVLEQLLKRPMRNREMMDEIRISHPDICKKYGVMTKWHQLLWKHNCRGAKDWLKDDKGIIDRDEETGEWFVKNRKEAEKIMNNFSLVANLTLQEQKSL